MILHTLKADIATLQVGAIVNAANSSLLGRAGVDGAQRRLSAGDLGRYHRVLNDH